MFWKEHQINCDVQAALLQVQGLLFIFLPKSFIASTSERAGLGSPLHPLRPAEPSLPSTMSHPRLWGGPGHSWLSYDRCGIPQHQARGLINAFRGADGVERRLSGGRELEADLGGWRSPLSSFSPPLARPPLSVPCLAVPHSFPCVLG